MALAATIIALAAPGFHDPHHRRHYQLNGPVVASWYYDAGQTACGFHAYYGIASRTLACGTRVVLQHAGRRVVATVDDRGPYVWSRLFDLNVATRTALQCSDLCLVMDAVL
jgi:rare lipoprotein A (peptidoglycan hydrolase)